MDAILIYCCEAHQLEPEDIRKFVRHDTLKEKVAVNCSRTYTIFLRLQYYQYDFRA